MEKGSKRKSLAKPLSACLLYCTASMSMLFANKYVMGVYQFDYIMTFILFQSICSCVVLSLAKRMGWMEINDLEPKKMLQWLPVNLLFVCLLLSGGKVLRHLAVSMVTVFKNLNIFIVVFAEKKLFNSEPSRGIVLSLVLMVVASLLAAVTDLEFNREGYMWMGINCLLQATYAIYLKLLTKKVQLTSFGMAYYNNVLASIILTPMVFLSGETNFVTFPYLYAPGFIGAVVVSGVVGACLSFSTFFLINVTSATTYSFTGALNKIPTYLVSVVLFSSPFSTANAASILLGLVAGVLFANAKLQQRKAGSTKLPTTVK